MWEISIRHIARAARPRAPLTLYPTRDRRKMVLCTGCQVHCQLTPKLHADIQLKCSRHRRDECPACRKLDDVQRRIDKARQALEILLEEQDALASTLNEYHDPFLNSLPFEISSRIFVHCPDAMRLATGLLDPPKAHKRGLKSVFTPSHVCLNWRRIIQATPQVWSSISIRITRRNCVESVPIFRDWLERSGAVPLRVNLWVEWFSVSQQDDETLCRAYRDLLTSTAAHADHWQSLGLVVQSASVSEILSTNRASRLEHITLHLDHCGDQSIEGVLQLKSSPRSLTLSGMTSLTEFPISIDWGQLTNVIMGGNARHVMQVVRNAPRLSNLHVNGGVRLREAINPPVVGTSLRSLTVKFVYSEFLDNFIFPSLVSVDVRMSPLDGHEAGVWPGVDRLLRRSACKVTSLVVDDQEIAVDGLLAVIASASSLTSLSIAGDILESLLVEMTKNSAGAPSSNPKFLDKLECIHSRMPFRYVEWSLLADLVTILTSRQDPSLRLLQIEYEATIREADPLDYLSANNLKLVVDASRSIELKIVGYDEKDLTEVLSRKVDEYYYAVSNSKSNLVS